MKAKYLNILCASMLALAMVWPSYAAAPSALAAPSRAPDAACVPSDHSGTINFDERWCLSDNPHYVSGSITIAAGATLTIEAGVTVYFNPGTAMNINGGLVAEGNTGQPITITSVKGSPAPGDWGGLAFTSTSTGSLAYCDISFGGSGISAGNGVLVQTSNFSMRNSRIHDTLNSPVYLQGSASLSPTFESVEIDHNPGDRPIRQETIAQHPKYTDIHLHDNGVDALYVYGHVTEDVVLDGGPTALNGAPIYYQGGNVNAGATLTITPGTTLKFAGNTGLNVIGGLVAEGSAGLPVTFTSQESSPEPGNWGAIALGPASRARFNHCDIGYGGAPGGAGFGLNIQSSHVEVRNTRIHHILHYPVYLQGAGLSPLLENVEIDHSPGDRPLRQETISQHPKYINVWLHDNAVDALYVYGHVTEDVTLDGSPAALNGAPVYYQGGNVNAGATLTITPGTTLKFAGNTGLNVIGSLVAEGAPALPIRFAPQSEAPVPGTIGAVSFAAGSHGRLNYFDFGYGGSGGGAGNGVYIASSDVVMRNSRIHHMADRAIKLNDNTHFSAYNLVVSDATGYGLYLNYKAGFTGLHTTLARNGTGAYVSNAATLAMTNTILSQNTTGLSVGGGGAANLVQTLWDANTTPSLGAFSESGHIDGPAWFELDGYHLTRFSTALGRGVAAWLTQDIDGGARPQPGSTPPDLGADEAAYLPGKEFAAEKIALPPQWETLVDPQAGEPYGRLRQSYLLRYYYGSALPDPPALTVVMTDTLPSQLNFEAETHTPAMSFTRLGQKLTWQTSAPVAAGQSGGAMFSTLYEQPEPGLMLTNLAGVTAGATHIALQAASQVPLFAPLITAPGNGEICPAPGGAVTILGTAQAGAFIRIYENGAQVASGTANLNGAFNILYTSSRVGVDASTSITARACAPSNPYRCSPASQTLTLTKPLSFWCPQRSIWSDMVNGHPVQFRFRNTQGWFSTQNWVFSGMFGFNDTDLSLYACNCPASSGSTAPPSAVWVVADGVAYYPSSSTAPWYYFDITGAAHTAVFWAQCGSNQISSNGKILIDPDGYVFDVTKGFDPEQPTLNAVSGVTVTAYISMPEWGGWTPWPAHLYNNQANPQVTGANGYFAFFTPPGRYYLQVEGISGYQSWRSPVVDVITQVVHLNVPYTPWTQPAVQVQLAPEGPSPAQATILPGQTIVWCAAANDQIPPHILARAYTDPQTRPLSALDPIASTLSWDGGRLIPSQCYRRQFTQPGAYTYTDGLGHSGLITVQHIIYLPLARKP